jgi:bisphosphoglycerate-dependent phosphoglycerate mutase
VFAYQQLVNFINKQSLKYSQVKQCIILLSNKSRFGYLQGNAKREQRVKFISEYIQEEFHGIDMPLTVISSGKKMNYKMLLAIMDNFEIYPTEQHENNKSVIEKLVTYRNKIAHGENSVIVHEEDINVMINSIMEMIDLVINDINNYVVTDSYRS